MQRAGQTIGTIDLLIATTAVVDGVPLLTGNRRHFEAMPGLRVLSYR
jgi:predicted nucleic acid-binding protein